MTLRNDFSNDLQSVTPGNVEPLSARAVRTLECGQSRVHPSFEMAVTGEWREQLDPKIVGYTQGSQPLVNVFAPPDLDGIPYVAVLQGV